MTPLPSIGQTSPWIQIGANCATPEQPGLFDLVLSIHQQGSLDVGQQDLACIENAGVIAPTALPDAQDAQGRTSVLQFGVARPLAAPPALVFFGGKDQSVHMDALDTTSETKAITASLSDGVKPQVVKSTLEPRPQITTLPQPIIVNSAVASTLDFDVEQDLDRKASDENASDPAALTPLPQIWALLTATPNQTVGDRASSRPLDVPRRGGEPSGPSTLAFLNGKGARVAAGFSDLPPPDEQSAKSLQSTVAAMLDAVPAQIGHAREHVSLASQQPLRTENSSVTPTHFASDIDTHQLDRLMRDISELTSTAGKTAFHLSSENLGRLQVRLESTEAGVSVAIHTDNERGHVTVSQAQKQLQDDLHANGLKVAETSVAMGQNGTDQQRSDRATQARPMPAIEVAVERSSVGDENQNDRPDGRFA